MIYAKVEPLEKAVDFMCCHDEWKQILILAQNFKDEAERAVADYQAVFSGKKRVPGNYIITKNYPLDAVSDIIIPDGVMSDGRGRIHSRSNVYLLHEFLRYAGFSIKGGDWFETDELNKTDFQLEKEEKDEKLKSKAKEKAEKKKKGTALFDK